MTLSSTNLSNLKPYEEKLQVLQMVGKLSITVMGDLSHSLPLKNIFICPGLSLNLLSVGQLVDNNCNVSFYSSGCVMGLGVGKGDCEGAYMWAFISTLLICTT